MTSIAVTAKKLDVKIGDVVEIEGRRYDVVSDKHGGVTLEPAVTMTVDEIRAEHGGRPLSRAEGAGARVEDELLTVAEIAGELRKSEQTVRQWIREGRLPALKAGLRGYRVYRSDLQRMVSYLRSKQSAGQQERQGAQPYGLSPRSSPKRTWAPSFRREPGRPMSGGVNRDRGRGRSPRQFRTWPLQLEAEERLERRPADGTLARAALSAIDLARIERQRFSWQGSR